MPSKDVNVRQLVIFPIGVVRTSLTEDDIRRGKREELHNIESTIEIFPAFQEALDGLEGFSHIFVLAYFDQLRPEQIGVLKVKPRGLLKYGFRLEELPIIGALASDSPTRPNPIALSLVQLKRVEDGRKLIVRGLDLFDGTPVIDIKPYQPQYRADRFEMPSWYEKIREILSRIYSRD